MDALVPTLRECVGEFAEGFAGLFAENVAHSIPPIKFLGDLAKLAWSIPDRILFRKIEDFLRAVPEDKREEFTCQTMGNLELRKKIGEHLVLALDQMDDFEKAEIHAKVFCAYVAGNIPLETLRRLSASINAAFLVDLKHIIESPASILNEFLVSLLRSGLSRPTVTPTYENMARLELTNLGKIFQQVMRDEPIIL